MCYLLCWGRIRISTYPYICIKKIWKCTQTLIKIYVCDMSMGRKEDKRQGVVDAVHLFLESLALEAQTVVTSWHTFLLRYLVDWAAGREWKENRHKEVAMRIQIIVWISSKMRRLSLKETSTNTIIWAIK